MKSLAFIVTVISMALSLNIYATTIIKIQGDKFVFSQTSNNKFRVGDFVDVYDDNDFVTTGIVKKIKGRAVLALAQGDMPAVGQKVILPYSSGAGEKLEKEIYSIEKEPQKFNPTKSKNNFAISAGYMQNEIGNKSDLTLQTAGLEASIGFNMAVWGLHSGTSLGYRYLATGQEKNVTDDFFKGPAAQHQLESQEIYFQQIFGIDFQISTNLILRPFIGGQYGMGSLNWDRRLKRRERIIDEQAKTETTILGHFKADSEWDYDRYAGIAGIQVLVTPVFIPYVKYEYGKSTYVHKKSEVTWDSQTNQDDTYTKDIGKVTNTSLSVGLSYLF